MGTPFRLYGGGLKTKKKLVGIDTDQQRQQSDPKGGEGGQKQKKKVN